MITRKSVTLRPIRPNAGLQANYRAELNALLRQVRDDVMAEVERYKDVPPQPNRSAGSSRASSPALPCPAPPSVAWASMQTASRQEIGQTGAVPVISATM